MAKVRWTLQAVDDVDAIASYIAKDSTHYAQMFAVKIFESVLQIENFPEAGRVVPEINQQNMREILLGNYRIIYRLKDDFIEILTVYHSSRLLNKNTIVT
ncbi:MAG TPA: type II toxin-antitoxin system RelE/ParE family toxin [Lentisphaeria bacterium]|nr:MAG: plasmid stabilization protein [Lentisphaerae bacterium GWF2_50_93]HCE45054.1 type II toxin-antitoxin system RelE/ParE family toxin [Lentisphaeria bacterium]